MERWTFTDHVLDPKARLLWRAGRPLHLEPKVMDLLLHLVEHRDEFVSKQALYQHLWGNLVVGQASLARLIKELRRALGDDGERQQFIRTVNARGYQFVATVERTRANPQQTPPASHESELEVTAPASSAGSPLDSTLCLHVLAPQQASIVLEGRGPFRIGRDPDSEIRIAGERASRQHAEIVRRGPVYFVRDQGSRNGTFVDCARIGQAALRPGQLLRAGDFLALVADAAAAFATPTTEAVDIAGVCVGPQLQRLLALLHECVRSRTPLVVRGEAGSGKASLARCLHARAGGADALRWLECAALTQAKLHEHLRRVESQPTTFVLRGIEHLHPELGAALDRALGNPQLRVIATGSPVSPTRAGLAFQLRAHTIELPALRERLVDLPGLVQHFLRAARGGATPEVSARLLEALCSYAWPSNVRELRELVSAMATTYADQPRLSVEHLPAAFLARIAAISGEADLGPTRASGIGLAPRQVQ